MNLFYKIVNKVNNKFYYGIHKTDNIYDNYMGSGTLIKKAIKKYGREHFEKTILYYFNTYEDALQFEKEFINKELIKDKNCYNMKEGGKGGGVKGWKMTDKQIKEMKERFILKPPPNKLTEEERKRKYEERLQKYRDETKKKNLRGNYKRGG